MVESSTGGNTATGSIPAFMVSLLLVMYSFKFVALYWWGCGLQDMVCACALILSGTVSPISNFSKNGGGSIAIVAKLMILTINQ